MHRSCEAWPATPTWVARSPARTARGQVSSQGDKHKAEAAASGSRGHAGGGHCEAEAGAGAHRTAWQDSHSRALSTGDGEHQGRGQGVALTFLPRRRPAGGRPSAACLTAATRISMSTLSCWLVRAAGRQRSLSPSDLPRRRTLWGDVPLGQASVSPAGAQSTWGARPGS